MRANPNTCVVATFALALAGCGGGGDGDAPPAGGGGGGTTPTAAVTGTGQKGPFQPGGTVTATELDAGGSPAEGSASGEVMTDGDFDLAALEWQGPTEVAVAGTYFDETAGNFSGDSRTLRAVVDATEATTTNVNLYTHLLAARILTRMGAGDGLADARSQARGELESLVDIATPPGELDLAEAGDSPSESDSANLLLFSAAVLAAGLDQAGIDAIATDFADDGLINGSAGDGQARWQSVQQAAATDEDLLDTARQHIRDQYGSSPPALPGGGGGGIGWLLDPCAAAKLTEPRVFCEDGVFDGTKGDDGGEPILYYPPESGFYAFALNDPADKLSFGGWTVYSGKDFSGAKVGDSDDDTFAAYEDATTFALDRGEPYAVQVNLSGLDQADDEFTLLASQLSEGTEREPVEIEAGQPHDGRVGELFTGSDGGPATSWYRVSTAGGEFEIATSHPPDTGPGGLRIKVYEGTTGQEGSNDIEGLPLVDLANPDGSSSTALTATLEGGKTYFVMVTNLYTDFRRSNFRPDAGWVEFTLSVTAR